MISRYAVLNRAFINACLSFVHSDSKLLRDPIGKTHPAWDPEFNQVHGFGGYCLCVPRDGTPFFKGSHLGSYTGLKWTLKENSSRIGRYVCILHPPDDGTLGKDEVVDAGQYGNALR